MDMRDTTYVKVKDYIIFLDPRIPPRKLIVDPKFPVNISIWTNVFSQTVKHYPP